MIKNQTNMCTQYYIHYACGHDVNSEFVQCPEREGTDTKCSPVTRIESKTSTHRCRPCLASE